MIIIYILAAIGGICVLGVAGLTILFVIAKDEPEERETTCVLTGEKCNFTDQKETCNDCPIAEEAEKIGSR